MNDAISFMLIILICSTTFIGIGVFSLKKKTPVYFWTNQKIKAHEISNVKSYNRENGIMWLTFGSSLMFCSMLQLVLGGIIGPILFLVILLVGIVVMSIKYGQIYNKYKI